MEHKPELYMAMIDTADIVAERYKVSREAQDAYSLESQRRTAAGAAGRNASTTRSCRCRPRRRSSNKDTKARAIEPVTLAKDEGNRPDTTLEGLAALKPVREGKFITAGNASQLSDGASACVVMDAKLAEKRGLKPLGTFRGFAVAGCEPDEMGIGPVFAVPKLLQRATASRSDDIDLWELNEAFASQVLYCRDRLGIPQEQAQRRRRRDLDRPSLRHERRAHDRPRADRRPPARRQARASSPCASAAAWAPPACSRYI